MQKLIFLILYQRIRPEEIIFHQELDILFDNNGHFTLDEAVVWVYFLILIIFQFTKNYVIFICCWKKLLDNIQKIDFLLFKVNYYEKIAPHIKFDDDPVPEEANKEQQKQQDEQQAAAESNQEENVNYDTEDDYVCSRFFFSSLFIICFFCLKIFTSFNFLSEQK